MKKGTENKIQLNTLNNKFINNWQRKKISNARAHQFKAFDTINDRIVTKRHGRQIELTDGTKLVEFASCSYFGLDQDPRLLAASSVDIENYGVNFAVARTRLRTQNFDILEKLLTPIFCNATTTLFTSLHLTHLGCLPLIASGEMPSFPIQRNGPVFIMDKKAHASIQIQKRLLEQFGQVISVDFQKHDALALLFHEAKINNLTPISLSDSVISMGGFAPITLLFELAEKYEGYVYLDDAHGTSLYGTHGAGYALNCLHEQFHPRLILTPSLSKAFGSDAAVLALPTAEDTHMVRRFAIPYLFSNPPANAAINAAIAAAKIHLTNEIYELQNKLWENVDYFDSHIKVKTLNQGEKTPIRGIWVGDENKTLECAKKLEKAGFFITAAMYPTVALGQAIMRVALSTVHTKENIASLCSHVNKFLA